MRTMTAVLLAACASACASQPPPPARPPLEPVVLRSPAELSGDFMWRQRVTASWQKRSRSFDAILQKQGDRLQLIGLTPFDAPIFTVTLKGTDVTFENKMGEELPFEPARVLLDIQRVFFPWPPGAGVSEKHAEGHLLERRFARGDRGELVIRYEGWQAGRRAPAKVLLDDPAIGYQLEIETTEESEL